MDIQDVLQWTDDRVLAKKGKHLDSLQRFILEQVWQGHKYPEIAKSCNRSEDHIKQVARELWKLLSDILGEDVKKSNVRSILEKLRFSNISNLWFTQDSVQKIGNINFCGEGRHCSEGIKYRSPSTTNTDDVKPETRYDLRDAPDLGTFYNYPSSPLSTLETWILEQNCRLLTITGMSGTGKSSIARHLIPQIQTQFDRIIWRSLRTSPPLEITLKNIIQFLSNSYSPDRGGHGGTAPTRGGEGDVLPDNTDAQLSILIETLRENRCLIILDDVQQILSSGQLAGNYKPGYENYGTLFKLIGELPHNSCLIINTWEPPLDILTFTDDNSAVCLLQLTGLGEAATEILREKGLFDEERWPELIELYQGNPLWLKLVAQTINNLFCGRVAQYLSYEPVFLCEEVGQILQQHYQRLSEIEKQAIAPICKENEPVSFTQLMAKDQATPAELFTAIRSLVRRGIIEKHIRGDEIVFSAIVPVKQYLNS